MATPKRGDTKKINGQSYRWAWSSKQKKFTWVRDHSKDKLSAKEGLRTKEIGGSWKNTTKGISNKANEVGLHNKTNSKSTTNQKYKSDKWTKTPNTKLKTWRVDSNENKQLQTERKEGKNETYTRVTSKNKEKLSSNKVDKSSTKSSGKKMHSIEKKNREIFGDKAIDKLKADHAKWKADRKAAMEKKKKEREERKKKLKANK